jgi:hypothetical protein
LSEYEKVIAGQPEFELARSRYHFAIYQNETGDAKRVAQEAFVAAAIVAAYWEQGQSATAVEALTNMGVPSRESGPFVELYDQDIPVRDIWFDRISPFATLEDQFGRNLEKLAQTQTQLEIALMLWTALPPDRRSALEAQLSDRFAGHPQRSEIGMPQFSSDSPSAPSQPVIEARIASLEAAIKQRPDLFENYIRLAALLVEEKGAYAQASAVLSRFPGFKDKGGSDAVALSNYSAEAGHIFLLARRRREHAPLLRDLRKSQNRLRRQHDVGGASRHPQRGLCGRCASDARARGAL